jgi:hypothetical protein
VVKFAAVRLEQAQIAEQGLPLDRAVAPESPVGEVCFLRKLCVKPAFFQKTFFFHVFLRFFAL